MSIQHTIAQKRRNNKNVQKTTYQNHQNKDCKTPTTVIQKWQNIKTIILETQHMLR